MSGRPLAIDLCTGLHGWAEGLVAEGYDVIGFDLEDMCAQFGQARPAHVHLVLQDILTLHGSQFKDAALIVASPPCQFFSYCAMPWSKAKALAAAVRADPVRLEKELALFNACFRIQREACAAAGQHIPLIVENVRGAQPWVGRAKWNYGSFYLWGDIPALMPMIVKAEMKNTGGSWFTPPEGRTCRPKNNPDGRKSGDQPWKVPGFRFDGSGKSFQSASVNGIKGGGDWCGPGADCSLQRRAGSKSSARKFASAMIAKIPLVLSRYIAATYRPRASELEAA